MPEQDKAAPKGPSQDPNHAAHIRHAASLPSIDREIAFLEGEAAAAPGDVRLATKLGDAKADKRNTAERLEHARRALAFVDSLGLTHEITATAVTYNDALNYVSRTLHSVSLGVTESEYSRGHKHLRGVTSTNEAGEAVHLCDDAKLDATRDPAAEVIAHLALTKPEQVAAARKLFAT
jgi:hypothetical protein